MPVPGDFSSAAFFIVAALLVPGSEIELREVGINRNRIGLLSILARMGVEMGGAHEQGRAMTVHEIREPGPEPIATLQVRQRAARAAPRSRRRTSRPRSTSCRWSPCSAASRRGRRWSSGAEELRAKESDRIAASSRASRAWAPRSRGVPTASSVRGTGGLRGGELDARGDHRLAMVGAIAGLASRGGRRGRRLRSRRGQLPGLRARPARATAPEACWEGCPSPGHGESTRRSRSPRRPRPRGAPSGRRSRAARGRPRPTCHPAC